MDATTQSVLDAQLVSETGALYLPQSVTTSWKVIPPQHPSTETLRIIHRLNSFGSLFYFAKVILGKTRFQSNPDPALNLHYQMCRVVEKDGLKEVIEIPRDHFKSSVYSECFPIWRALPFTESDEITMRTLGYGDDYILWMKRAHQQDIRQLLVSEVITNATKLGVKISAHYENNAIFRWVFPEIVPGTSETWKDDSLHQKRTPAGRIHGEGTYDFIGVGGALQSRHYNLVIQDDLVGKNAIASETEMKKVIEYHQLLVGAFDSESGNGGRDNDEIVVGNRWSYNDLNSYLRTNERYFNFTTHSALGGCCAIHPYGVPIFPEEQSLAKLERWKGRLGTYFFSCQFLNSPINPNEVKFDKKNLRRFEYVQDMTFMYSDAKSYTGGQIGGRPKSMIRHHVKEGVTIADIAPRNLRRYIISDPNHSGNDGRCRHAITVTGVADNPRRVYLLETWAEACSIDDYINKLLELTCKWKLTDIWLETIAAQKYLKYHLEYKLKVEAYKNEAYQYIKIKELKTPKTANAKMLRIDGLGPITERGELWVPGYGMGVEKFEEEYEGYPSGKLRDILDTLGYGPQVWGFQVDEDDIMLDVIKQRERYARNIRHSSTGY